MIKRKKTGPQAHAPRACGPLDLCKTNSASCHGLTLIEVLISTMLTGVVMLAALNALGAATKGSLEGSRRGVAMTLAAELTAEILEQPYLDPDDTPAFGTESGESASPRADFDDVDDYDNWTAGPPQDKSGNTLANRTGWSRSVIVEHVDQSNITVANSDTNDEGVKRVIVTVYYNGDLKETLAFWTSVSWPPVSE